MPVDYISLEYMVKETKKRKINFSHTQTNTKLVRKALFLLLLQQIMECKGLLICSFQCRADVRRKKKHIHEKENEEEILWYTSSERNEDVQYRKERKKSSIRLFLKQCICLSCDLLGGHMPYI